MQVNALKICSSNNDYKCVVTKANTFFSLFCQSKMARRPSPLPRWKPSYGGYEEERFEHEVDSKLLCPICSNVLKDPVQCRNEHYFCRSCIKKHLHENSETCPVCQNHLTEEILTKPPRLLTNMLECLKIRCDHANRGCRELIKLEFLPQHVKSCGYSPARCTNPGCSQVFNQHEKERHEHELCPFGMIVCDNCEEQVLRKSKSTHPCVIRKEVDQLVKDMKEVKDEVKQMKLNQDEFLRNLMVQFDRQNDVVNDLCRKMEETDLFTGRQKIFVLGGRDEKCFLSTAESYSWSENSWTEESSMNAKRSAPSAFVHDRQIYVSGGWTGTGSTDSIESLNGDKEHKEWVETAIKMPLKCIAHKMVCHENNAILTGGRDGDNVSDGIYEIKLNPPHTSRLLTKMPKPRCGHGCNIIDNQVVIVGGKTSKRLKDAKNTVYVYDINTNECKTLPPLPFRINQVALVSYKGNVILIGGVNEKEKTLNTVAVYDLKTGNIKMLPCLNHKRAGSAAVISGNVIVVAGGYDCESKSFLQSVECLDLNTNVWRELAPMRTKRSAAAAVLKPVT